MENFALQEVFCLFSQNSPFRKDCHGINGSNIVTLAC